MKQQRQENLIYLAVWGLLFAAPLLSLYVRTASDSNIVFNWTEVFIVWRHFAVYLVLFLIHNFLLAPLLVHRHKRALYCATVAVMLAGFTVYQCSNKPKPPKPLEAHQAQKTLPHPLPEGRGVDRLHNDPPFEEEGNYSPPNREGLEEGLQEHHRPPLPPPHPERRGADRPHNDPPFKGEGNYLPPYREGPGEGLRGPEEGLRREGLGLQGPHGERDILAIVVLILMCGANLGIKGYFRGRDDRKRLAKLERENLEQQLEYLRYQINPHFFMNTLNNIHALVDIDPEKAKDTILELSKMMRFVLYEGNKQGVPLARELDFIRHYVTLMQLRYTEKVKITLDLPREVPDRQIPPLILITFIENAFKHGVSYQHDSFIEIKANVSHPSPQTPHLLFSCRNSKAEKPNQEKGGIGLQNVKQRLNLLYDNNYTLKIHDDNDVYIVELEIPLT